MMLKRHWTRYLKLKTGKRSDGTMTDCVIIDDVIVTDDEGQLIEDPVRIETL